MYKPTVRFVESIRYIDRSQWEACFPDELEGFDYHLAIEKAGLPGFEFGWYLAESDERLIGIVPAFFTTYDLATTAQGLTQRAIRSMRPFVPGRLTLKLSCLGSPETECCPLGFHRDLNPIIRSEVLKGLLTAWSAHGRRRGIGLFGIKDLSERDRTEFSLPIESLGYRSVSSLPTARIAVDFASVDEYFSRLSRATRKDLRRKLKGRADVTIDFRSDPGEHLDEIMAMYRETRARGEWAFEDIPHAYFSEVLTHMPGKALLVLYFSGGRLTAANLLLKDGSQLIDKFFVMRASEGRAYNLYFLSWIVNLEFCLSNGLKSYQSGQAAYETKLRLGSQLSRNWIYFRHHNPVFNMLLRAASPLLAIAEPENAGLHQTALP